MSFASLASALKSKIIAMDLFKTTHVSIGDDRILGQGRANCVIIYPGEMAITDAGQSREDRHWTADLDYFYRVKSDPGTDWSGFITGRDALITELRKWPQLGLTDGTFLKDVGVAAKEKPQHVYDSEGRGPFFIMQRISATIVEGVNVTGGDYD